MKKIVKKILVLACVAVFAVSSMTVMAAEARAVACPKFCGGTLIENSTIEYDVILGAKKCPYVEGKIDIVEVTVYEIYQKCGTCNYEYKATSHGPERVYCDHQN